MQTTAQSWRTANTMIHGIHGVATLFVVESKHCVLSVDQARGWATASPTSLSAVADLSLSLHAHTLLTSDYVFNLPD